MFGPSSLKMNSVQHLRSILCGIHIQLRCKFLCQFVLSCKLNNQVAIHDPNELEEIYDAITYKKSNSIIRMLFDYLGEETFRKGLQVGCTATFCIYDKLQTQTLNLWCQVFELRKKCARNRNVKLLQEQVSLLERRSTTRNFQCCKTWPE